ncbi:hypothetical protein T440DRAFT_400458 [Plenodomus tracheiphilus IPT5]|uniref:Rhodopsin domain-containing protein n=1 Tax=Plenodomus tracheiphilus IPT5 TaxID=1408161 RepID=A0A6A7B3G4_9PLEO|nr:hypothetical protein T440DRAFT_400458 [Plenodomus tracheiphilus IPT5]
MASLGVALDAVTWLLPHYVVWRLRLRLAHRIAITAIFAFGLITLVIGALRITALSDLIYQGVDVPFRIGTSLLWAIAQISTGIIVACCPHLRPVFEKVLPDRLTRVTTRRSDQTLQQPPILVTTRIDLKDSHKIPPAQAVFHDGQLEPWAPSFDVEKGPATEIQIVSFCCGGSRGCSCF